MWTLLVEVADVDAEDVLELAAPEDRQPVEALPAHAANPALGVGVRFGAWTGVRMISMAAWRLAGPAAGTPLAARHQT